MLFVRERFLEKQIKMNFSIRRLVVLINSLFQTLCDGLHGYITSFGDNCIAHQQLLEEKDAQECSVCELKVKKSSIIICRSCKHGGHKEHIREWFKKNQHCPQCLSCHCFKN